MERSEVVVCRAPRPAYPQAAPFHPGERYPESRSPEVAAEGNAAYETVRRVLRTAGLDAERFGTPDWNPLGAHVRPGDTVLLKPNLVKEGHPRDPEGWR